jgi:hypothetical protein
MQILFNANILIKMFWQVGHTDLRMKKNSILL